MNDFFACFCSTVWRCSVWWRKFILNSIAQSIASVITWINFGQIFQHIVWSFLNGGGDLLQATLSHLPSFWWEIFLLARLLLSGFYQVNSSLLEFKVARNRFHHFTAFRSTTIPYQLLPRSWQENQKTLREKVEYNEKKCHPRSKLIWTILKPDCIKELIPLKKVMRVTLSGRPVKRKLV